VHRFVVLALPVVILGGGCSIAFDPERYDDVPRCRYDDDCPVPDDPRFANVCTVSDEYEDPSFSRICSPRPAASCDPDDYAYDTQFRSRVRQAVSQRERYLSPCIEHPGAAGCVPPGAGCMPGLSVNPASGRCDDDDPGTPPAVAPEEVVALQDVLDQFCRSVYCGTDFACDVGSDSCVPCEVGKPLGRGGCGDLYPHGERSSVYLGETEMQAACPGADGELGDVPLGELEMPPPTQGDAPE
jgi:hypothetical protein